VTGITRIGEDHWELRARARCPDTGRKLSAKRRVRCTEAQAVLAREELVAQLFEGRGKRQRVTFGAFASTWLERKMKRGGKASGIATRDANLRNHLLPRFGDWYVDAIRRKDVEAWLTDCAAGKHAARTVNNWLQLLQNVVASAYRDMEMGPSPLERIEPLAVQRRKRDDPNSLTSEQLRSFLGAVDALAGHRYAMVFLGFTTGLRFGELTALRWEDLDEKGAALHVSRAQWRGKVGAPKTESSYRTITLVQEQLDALRDHRRAMVATQHTGIASGYVFPSTTGGFLSASGLNKLFARAAEEAGLPFRVTSHAMRRTFNNLLRQAGVGSVVLHSLTGHSSNAMTELYSTVGNEEKAGAVAVVVGIAKA